MWACLVLGSLRLKRSASVHWSQLSRAVSRSRFSTTTAGTDRNRIFSIRNSWDGESPVLSQNDKCDSDPRRAGWREDSGAVPRLQRAAQNRPPCEQPRRSFRPRASPRLVRMTETGAPISHSCNFFPFRAVCAALARRVNQKYQVAAACCGVDWRRARAACQTTGVC